MHARGHYAALLLHHVHLFPSPVTPTNLLLCSACVRDATKIACECRNDICRACGSDCNTSYGSQQVNMLRERNKNYGDAIKFVDICADGYAAEENCNIDFETVNLDLIIVTVDLPPIDAHLITLVGYMVSREGLGVLSLANWHYSKTAERFIRLLRSGDHGHHCA